MNKNIFGIACLVMVMLSACYRDKGNYDYTLREEIVLQGVDSVYNVISGETVLDLKAELTPQDDYDYLWFLQSPGKIGYDTLSLEQSLVWEANIPQGAYTLYLKATSRSDGYSRIFSINVWSVSDYSDGWFLLKGIDGMTDVDFHSAVEEKVIPDLLLKFSGERMKGKPGDISYMPYVYFLPSEGEARMTKMFWACSSEDAWLVDVNNMNKEVDWESMFLESGKDELPLFNMPGYQGMFMCSTGNSYYLNTQGQVTCQFGLNSDFGEEGLHPAGYGIGLTGLTGFYIFDRLNQRFVALTSNGNEVTFLSERENGESMVVDVNHTGTDLCYMGVGKRDSKVFYAVMEDESSRYVYTVNIHPYIYTGPYWNPIVKAVPVSGKKLNEATLFAVHSTHPYIYYNDATGEAVHYYDATGDKEVTDVLRFPGERITFMKDLFYDATGNNASESYDKFAIATEKDGHYKVYLYEMLNGRPDASKEPEILEGEGFVSSMTRARKSMNAPSTEKISGNFGVGMIAE